LEISSVGKNRPTAKQHKPDRHRPYGRQPKGLVLAGNVFGIMESAMVEGARAS
jgi:hypothetical protein